MLRSLVPPGQRATHPTAKHCRDFLLTVLDVCHHMVFTSAIKTEWDEHQSGFARTWRLSMFARKKIDRVDAPIDDSLREQLAAVAVTEKREDEMLKDVHLIEAARAAGLRVVARDEAVRALFRTAALSVVPLRNICWINPDIPDEDSEVWLRKGAPADAFRKLGYLHENQSRRAPRNNP
jgi:hypothetical protein